MTDLEQLKELTDEIEGQPRMFTDERLQRQLELHTGNVQAAAYIVLIQKSQSTAIVMAGMTLPDQQNYWLRRAAAVRPSHSHNAPRADDPPLEVTAT